MSVNTSVPVPNGCTVTDASSAANNCRTSRHPHASARARPEIVADTANDPREPDANIRRYPRVHARVTSVRGIPLVCRAFVLAVTLACPRFPTWFQDGKEGVDGSSPSEGSAKAPRTGLSSFSVLRVVHDSPVWSMFWSSQIREQSNPYFVASGDLRGADGDDELAACSS